MYSLHPKIVDVIAFKHCLKIHDLFAFQCTSLCTIHLSLFLIYLYLFLFFIRIFWSFSYKNWYSRAVLKRQLELGQGRHSCIPWEFGVLSVTARFRSVCRSPPLPRCLWLHNGYYIFLRNRDYILHIILMSYIPTLTKTPLTKHENYNHVLASFSRWSSSPTAETVSLKPTILPIKKHSFWVAPRAAH
jgi:hypothetical protein